MTRGAAVLVERAEAKDIICRNHYSHSFPTGWTLCIGMEGAICVWAIPANKNLAHFLFGGGIEIRELSRLWAMDGHSPNLLTQLIAGAVRALRLACPKVEACVSYADPNVGHEGFVYRAASWLYTGQATESRYYQLPDGSPVARRAFHSGSHSRPPDLPVLYRPGKHRYVRCLSKRARKNLRVPIVNPA